MGTEDTTVIKWAWRHHVLGADTFDSIRDAVLAAESASDMGDESLDCIEVIENGGARRLTAEEYDAIVGPIQAEEEARWKALPKSVVALRLASPAGRDWAFYQGFADRQKAEEEAEHWRQRLGADRVKLESIR